MASRLVFLCYLQQYSASPCVDCPTGKFSDEEGATVCTTCPVNSTSSAGTQSAEDCFVVVAGMCKCVFRRVSYRPCVLSRIRVENLTSGCWMHADAAVTQTMPRTFYALRVQLLSLSLRRQLQVRTLQPHAALRVRVAPFRVEQRHPAAHNHAAH